MEIAPLHAPGRFGEPPERRGEARGRGIDEQRAEDDGDEGRGKNAVAQAECAALQLVQIDRRGDVPVDALQVANERDLLIGVVARIARLVPEIHRRIRAVGDGAQNVRDRLARSGLDAAIHERAFDIRVRMDEHLGRCVEDESVAGLGDADVAERGAKLFERGVPPLGDLRLDLVEIGAAPQDDAEMRQVDEIGDLSRRLDGAEACPGIFVEALTLPARDFDHRGNDRGAAALVAHQRRIAPVPLRIRMRKHDAVVVGDPDIVVPAISEAAQSFERETARFGVR